MRNVGVACIPAIPHQWGFRPALWLLASDSWTRSCLSRHRQTDGKLSGSPLWSPSQPGIREEHDCYIKKKTTKEIWFACAETKWPILLYRIVWYGLSLDIRKRNEKLKTVGTWQYTIFTVSIDINFYHLLCHDCQEISEGDLPCAIPVHFPYHLFDLLLLRFKAQSSHRNLEQQGVKHS